MKVVYYATRTLTPSYAIEKKIDLKTNNQYKTNKQQQTCHLSYQLPISLRLPT
jgi:hypothetical protein